MNELQLAWLGGWVTDATGNILLLLNLLHWEAFKNITWFLTRCPQQGTPLYKELCLESGYSVDGSGCKLLLGMTT